MICDCGNQVAINMVMSIKGVTRCEKCSDTHIPSANYKSRRPIPTHFNQQLGRVVSESNYKQIEAERGIKFVNQPFDEYVKSGENKKAHKEHKQERSKKRLRASKKRKHKFLELLRK